MFTAYYALNFNPFTNEIDTKYSFQSKDFVQASARLELLRQHKGIGLLNGKPGCGKSFVLRCFVSSLSKSLYKTVYIPITTLTVREFYRALCDGLGIIPAYKKVDLCILILCGQPKLVIQLSRQPHEALRQRISINYTFNGLSRTETQEYIKSRFKACRRVEPPVDEDAYEFIYTITGGFPRKINNLMNMALLTGFAVLM